MLEKDTLANTNAAAQEHRGAPRGLRAPEPLMDAQRDEPYGRT